jgi:hypothetical protein
MTDARELGGGAKVAGWRPALLALDVSLFRRPPAMRVVRQVSHAAGELACLDAAALTRDNLFDVGFDALVASLSRLPRADTEPDGFFVLSGLLEPIRKGEQAPYILRAFTTEITTYGSHSPFSDGQLDGRDWRLSGQIHELDERVWRVDLRGACPSSAFDSILLALGWPQTPVAFQLVQLGLTLDEEDFRRCAAQRDG